CTASKSPAAAGSDPLPLHDALPILAQRPRQLGSADREPTDPSRQRAPEHRDALMDDHHFTRRVGQLDDRDALVVTKLSRDKRQVDRKSTRLNSSHVKISYAVFCLKK